jgi:hypothetical protein
MSLALSKGARKNAPTRKSGGKGKRKYVKKKMEYWNRKKKR